MRCETCGCKCGCELPTEVEIAVDAVSKTLNVAPAEISTRRAKSGKDAFNRKVAYYLLHRLTGNYSLTGRALNKDHSTCIAGINIIRERMKGSPEFAKWINSLEKEARLRVEGAGGGVYSEDLLQSTAA